MDLNDDWIYAAGFFYNADGSMVAYFNTLTLPSLVTISYNGNQLILDTDPDGPAFYQGFILTRSASGPYLIDVNGVKYYITTNRVPPFQPTFYR